MCQGASERELTYATLAIEANEKMRSRDDALAHLWKGSRQSAWSHNLIDKASWGRLTAGVSRLWARVEHEAPQHASRYCSSLSLATPSPAPPPPATATCRGQARLCAPEP